ncbi:MAG: hypothetical protein JNM02_01445 [Anaerolineales bacterium]|nr:hypothetical protein [Anaerolineales bacterium]
MPAARKKDGLNAGDNSIVIGGNVQGSNIVIGNENKVVTQSIKPLFREIYRKLDEEKNIKPEDKEDLRAELEEIQTALEIPEPDETFLARRFRNLKRMAPEIAEIAIETLKNPVSGVAEVIKRIVKKAADEANAK